MADSHSPHYHVFLSHNSQDKGTVEPLAVMLREKGLNPFLDKWNLVPGEPIEDGLIEALEHSDSAVVFVGPGGEGPWQSEEMRDILKRSVKSHNEFRAIPVLLPGASAEALEKSFLSSRLWIDFQSIDDDDALLRLAKAIQGEAYGDESFQLPDEPAPYRGLERFERIEQPQQDFFFGRDDEIRALIKRLVKERFVAVVGASGSGKSSLIRAGLSKQLAEELQPGIRRWQTITVEPGSAPFRSLAVQIAVAAGIGVAEREGWIEQAVEKWTATSDGVRSSIEAIFADAQEPLLIFIDQFEELFTHRREGAEHERIVRNFVANLVDVWRGGGDRVRVVVALRADFVERCLEIGPLKELLQDRTMLVGEVGDDALREIVKEPAARVGAFLEKGLMERILTEVRHQSGSLPLLQQALHELWRNRRGAWLTHEAYDASGGVAGALNDQAQAAYRSLHDEQKRIADKLFPRLITLGEGVSDTRRRVKRNELYPQGVAPADVNEVIDRLSGRDARILVTTREGSTAEDLGSGEDFVEFTHEALLGNWEYLVKLLDRERESIRKHRTLTTAAEEWYSKPEGEQHRFLLRAGQLVIAEQWVTEQDGVSRLNVTERLFLEESIQERTAEEARKAKIARRLKWLSVGATIAAVVAMVLGGFALQEKRKADTERDDGLRLQSLYLADAAQQQLSEGDAVTAALLGLEGLQNPAATDERQRNRPYVREVYFSLQSASRALREQVVLSGHQDHVTNAAFSPDGRHIVTVSEDKTALLWDAATNRVIHTLDGHQDVVWNAAFSPDGERVVTVSADKTARVWNVATGQILHVIEGHQDVVWSVAFSRDGRRIVTASDDATARLWDVETWKPLKTFEHKEVVYSAGFHPDRTIVVTGSGDHHTRIWDVDSGLLTATLTGHTDEVYRATFSPDGRRIATASRDKSARLWDAQSHAVTHVLTGHTEDVYSVVFSPDGTRLLTASQDGTARSWDTETGKSVRILKGHAAGLNSVAFRSDGLLAITTSNDRTARVWNVEAMGSLIGHSGIVWHAGFSPDEASVVTASQDGTARIWDVATGHVTRTFADEEKSALNAAALSPDGKLIVTASVDATARIRDVITGTELQSLQGHEDWVFSARFSRDGKSVLTSGDKTARIWDAATGTAIHVLHGHRGWVYDAAFSPDGTHVVTASDDRTAVVWDLATGKQIRSLKGHGAAVKSAAFSPDGIRVVTASEDRTARIWDVASGQEIRQLIGHKGKVVSAAFSTDNARIVTASQDNSARLWDALTGDVVRVLHGHSAEVNSAAFSTDGTRLVTGSADGTAHVWDLSMKSRQELIDHARASVPRCLTREDRMQFFLPPEPPAWYIETGKWPYNTQAWKQWLADRKAGRNVNMPDE